MQQKMSTSIHSTQVPSVTGINYLPVLPMSRLSGNSGKAFQTCLPSSCDPIKRPVLTGSLFIRHRSFTKGNLHSEKITILTEEEEEKKKKKKYCEKEANY